VAAVFESWWSDRARFYRAANGIPDDPGTAVTVQQMVFGNGGGQSGSGVGFTRDPATGERRLYLDFSPCSQGEDVVSGRARAADAREFEQRLPELHASVRVTAALLEREFRDAQEFEFTIEDGRLFFLQARGAKRTPLAALRIAADMFDEGLVTAAEARDRVRDVDPASLEELRVVDPAGAVPVASAVAASVGVAAGRAAFDPARAVELAADGTPVILVREDLATGDIAGLQCAAGVLTARGSRTSHAAVVARQLGKVCLVACEGLSIHPGGDRATLGGRLVEEGDLLCLDSATGTVFAGQPRLARSCPEALLARLESWRREPLPAGPDTAGTA
jgi:pyruvate,orthophosphate dikinase